MSSYDKLTRDQAELMGRKLIAVSIHHMDHKKLPKLHVAEVFWPDSLLHVILLEDITCVFSLEQKLGPALEGTSPIFFCPDEVREDVAVWARTAQNPIVWSMFDEDVWMLPQWPCFAGKDPRSACDSVTAFRRRLAADFESESQSQSFEEMEALLDLLHRDACAVRY